MKKLLLILFLLAGYLASGQQIGYTPMTAAGYQFKYGKFDSLIHVPFGDTAIKRGTTRPGALMCFTGDSLVYRWDGLRWHLFADGDNGTVLDTTFRWSVLDSLNTPPGSPATGDVYEVGTVPTGAWVGHAREIATWDGAAWTFETANAGDLLYNVANDLVSKFNGTNWIRVGKAAIHQGGDRYATNIFVGPLDNFSFTVKTNNVDRFQISNTGVTIFKQLTGVGNALMGLTSAGAAQRIASIDSVLVPALHSQTYYDLRYLQNITGLVTAGTNVTVTGSGTSGSPYVVNSSGGAAADAVDSIWRTPGKDSILYSIDGRQGSIKDSIGIPFTSDGIDSITFYGNTLCQWSAGVPTCYQLDRFYENVVFNHDTTMYIASSGGIVIDSFPIFYTKIFAGTNMVIRDTTLPSGETGYILDASGGGIGGSGITELGAGYGLTIINDSTYDVDSIVIATRERLVNELSLKQDVLSLTTTGSSGAATLVGATLNIPQYSGGAAGGRDTTVPVWNRRGIVMTGYPVSEGMNNYEMSVIRERDPVILTADTIVFKMWYTSGWNTRVINYAESVDGINWVKYASNPVVTGHSRSFVLKNGSTYIMYATVNAATQIDQYTSTDGVTWVLANAAVISQVPVYNCSVIIDGATWRMLVDGYSAAGNTGYYQNYYTSPDGIVWTIQNGGSPVMVGRGQDCPMLKKIGSTYYVWLTETYPYNVPVGPSDIYRLSSPDMITWTEDSPIPTFPRRQADEGPQTLIGQVVDAHLLEVDSSVYMYYAASTNNGDSAAHQQIKLAIANMPFDKLVLTKEGDGADVILPQVFANSSGNDKYFRDGSIVIGGGVPDSKAILDLQSTTKSFLPPRMTTTERDAISSPPAGSTIYNSTLNSLNFYNGTSWLNPLGWSLTGNSAIDTATNFHGTTDTKPILWRQNNTRIGYIGSRLTSVYFGSAPTSATTTAALLNAVYGWNAGAAISTGTQNTFIGSVAGNLATTGTGNTAVGYFASGAFTTGDYKTSLGWSAGKNATGNYTVAIGHNALTVANTGAFNISIGQASMNGVGAGGLNVAVGVQSLFSNTSGASNVAMGSYSGNYNTTVGSQFFINALDRASYVRDQTESLLYGKFNATVLSQTLTHNAKTGIYNWSPTAYLQLPAGTTAANTAPLKLTYTNLATTATSGTGTVATVTFAAQTIPPFIIGTSIVIAGVTPAGYNGTKTVTVCTTTTVSFADATTGAQTVAGTIIQGHLLATPEPGTIEYDGDHFYGTDKTGTRIQLDN